MENEEEGSVDDEAPAVATRSWGRSFPSAGLHSFERRRRLLRYAFHPIAMISSLQRASCRHYRRGGGAASSSLARRLLSSSWPRQGAAAAPAAAAAAAPASHAARTMASAATSSQKRALNQEQLQGKPSATPSSAPTPASSAPSGPPSNKASGSAARTPAGPPSGPPSGPASSSSGSFPVMGVAAAGAAVALGGGAFYLLTDRNAAHATSITSTPSPRSTAGASVAKEKKATESSVPTVVEVKEEAKVVEGVPTSTDGTPAPTREEPIGNRVISITVPDKMKGGVSDVAATVPVVTHPPDGHRVSIVPTEAKSKGGAGSSSSPPPPRLVEDIGMTQRALLQLQTATLEQASDAVVSAHQSLWSSVADGMGGGAASSSPSEGGEAGGASAAVDAATAAQLQAKVARLASELSERTKWEAVRLKEFLAMKEQETAQKYQELLQTQRLEFEDILARRLREQEHALSTQFQQAMADKEGSIQTLLKTALDTQQAEHENDKKAFEHLKAAEIAAQLEQEFGQKLEEYKAAVAQELERKVATLTELSKQLASLESALAASKSSRQGSVKAHKLSATALALSQKLETSQPAGTELLALQAAAGEKGVIPAALKTIPNAVYSQGAPTVPELQARFDDVYRQCRRAALVPGGRAGLEGQLAGIVFSALKYPPGPEDPAPDDEPDHPEYVLVRAKRHVQLGELEKAVEQLEKLGGQVAFTASDWKASAMNRVAVEKALKVIKLECALVNESLVE